MESVKRYIDKARAKGLDDEWIKELLVDAGWNAHEINTHLVESPDLVPPLPDNIAVPVTVAPVEHIGSPKPAVQEIAVVSGGFSVRGFEYLIYYIAMGMTAFSIAALLHVNADDLFGTSSYYAETGSFWIAGLIVALPIFIFMMIRLKKQELNNPTPVTDTTKRRATQLMLLITFLIGVGRVIGFIFHIIEGGSETAPITEELVHTIITVTIAGSIFFPLWRANQKSSTNKS